MKMILLGAPGAGKGTQASVLSERLQIPCISTGNIFRDHIRRETELGLLAKSYIDRGELCPDEVTLRLIEDRLAQQDCKNGYILDGFPRTIVQAEGLDRMTNVDCAVNLDVEDAFIVNRMGGRRVCPACGESYHVVNLPPKADGVCDKCGEKLIVRPDDAPETVKNRLCIYHEQTAPLVEYYEKRGKLRNVDGMQPMTAVTEAIMKAIEA